MAHHHFADALDVRVQDFDLDLGAHRHAGGVGIDRIRLVQRIGAEQFGLAIQRAQRYAHGAEEPESVGAERGTAGCGRAQPREAEAVAQRAEQHRVGERRMLTLVERG